jgi:hypothetical protein
MLTKLGFRTIKTYGEPNDFIHSNLEDLWPLILTLPGPRVPIMGMNEGTRARFKDEYFAKLRPMFRQDGLNMSLGAAYALGKR